MVRSSFQMSADRGMKFVTLLSEDVGNVESGCLALLKVRGEAMTERLVSHLSKDQAMVAKGSLLVLMVSTASVEWNRDDLRRPLLRHTLIVGVEERRLDAEAVKGAKGLPSGVDAQLLTQVHSLTKAKAGAAEFITLGLFLLSYSLAAKLLSEAKDKWAKSVASLKYVLQKLSQFNDHVARLREEKEKVIGAIDAEKQTLVKAQEETKELTVMLERKESALVSSKIALDELREQMSALEEEKTSTHERASARFTAAKDTLAEALTEEEVNVLLATPPRQAATLGRLLAAVIDGSPPSSADTSSEESSFAWRAAHLKSPETIARLEGIIPFDLPYPVTAFLSAEVRRLEENAAADGDGADDAAATAAGDTSAPVGGGIGGSIALDALVEYFSGLHEMLNGRDDVCEADVRLNECQLLVASTESVRQEEQKDAKALREDIEATEAKIRRLKGAIGDLQAEAVRLDGEISSAEALSTVFSPLERAWRADMDRSSEDERAIERQAVLKAAAHCYLAGVPQVSRPELFNAMLVECSDSSGSADELTGLADCWTPWSPSNLLSTTALPGWLEGLASRVAFVLDPHDAAAELFSCHGRLRRLHLVDDDHRRELQKLLMVLHDRPDGQGGEQVEEDMVILVEQFSVQDFEFLRTLTVPPWASVFFLVSQLATAPHPPPPPDVFFVDLSLTPTEAAQLLSARRRQAAIGEDAGHSQTLRVKELTARLESARSKTYQAALDLCTDAKISPSDVTAAVDDFNHWSAQLADEETIARPDNVRVDPDSDARSGGGGWPLPEALLAASTHLTHHIKGTYASFSRYLATAVSCQAAFADSGREEDFGPCFTMLALHHREEDVPLLKLLACVYMTDDKPAEDILQALSRIYNFHFRESRPDNAYDQREESRSPPLAEGDHPEDDDDVERTISEPSPPSPRPPPSWCPPTTLGLLREVSVCGRGLAETLEEREEAWRSWFEDPAIHPAPVTSWTDLSLALALKPHEASFWSSEFIRTGCRVLHRWSSATIDLKGT
jgi:hypothetical protein